MLSCCFLHTQRHRTDLSARAFATLAGVLADCGGVGMLRAGVGPGARMLRMLDRLAARIRAIPLAEYDETLVAFVAHFCRQTVPRVQARQVGRRHRLRAQRQHLKQKPKTDTENSYPRADSVST